ncbi:hypothetical protein C6P40_003519 [Pichia californica]|uniref:Sugar phosphate phosphatase n=1 Tax=Pichia californica TaxID=460514 RepID=A0A9P6WRQ4_9ASCO|nr:hypothetical protein C6P42_004743 [[Candida] californica]KAG0691268.1 hypothetical protein C6P40_003519 [[Candida] californica]
MIELPGVYNLGDPTSFAFSTARERWPTIIGNCKVDVSTHINESNDPELAHQGKIILQDIQNIIDDIKNGALIRKFTEEEVKLIPSLQSYNDKLDELNEPATYLQGPWLLIECYLYRILDLNIKSQSKWIDFDVFEASKRSAFVLSKSGIYELAIRYHYLSKEIKNTNDPISIEKLSFLFEEFIDVSLWGNATDLSLLANATLEDIQSRQGQEARAESSKNIIDNDLPEAWKRLLSVPFEQRRIDFVLDNAGFEFYSDLSLSLFLLDSKLVKNVTFHCKTRPWMVSDTMIKDYKIFIKDMLDETSLPDHREEINYFVKSIEHYHENKQFQLVDSEFWTSALDHWDITPQETNYGGNKLYNYFQDSTLVIVKGDLNYRKLTGDMKWPRTTPFGIALNKLANSNIHILALRTCKSDVCVGLAPGVEEKLNDHWKSLGNKIPELWCSSGQWAVISYNPGKFSP